MYSESVSLFLFFNFDLVFVLSIMSHIVNKK